MLLYIYICYICYNLLVAKCVASFSSSRKPARFLCVESEKVFSSEILAAVQGARRGFYQDSWPKLAKEIPNTKWQCAQQ